MPTIKYLSLNRLRVQGKFFFAGEEKVFLKGVSYGPFITGTHGAPLPEEPVIEKDFELMQEIGVNCIRVYIVPPGWFLELAEFYGLRVLVGIPWSQHITFLDSEALKSEIRQTIAHAVQACRHYPAAFAYLVGNEISPEIVRWYGAAKIQAFLQELMAIVKDNDPNALVSYANYPCTEYLNLDCVDFLSFNVYLHSDRDFRGYLSRLHNLAVEKPLVFSEFGADSIREGLDTQAAILSQKLAASFEMGVAGTFIFSWTDEWFTGGHAIQDWAFGVVTENRQNKPAFKAVQHYYQASLPPALTAYPQVSVIVCAYNAERTMESCLASLEKLNYPNYEVIVVNDGSTDRTLEICQQYPYIKLICQPNYGLSVARNVGLEAATGEIIAYTDSDCYADPDWLTYLVITFQSTGLSAVGGPNFQPPEDSLIPSCVAVSPGCPTHVLLGDDTAEHIAGCNMAFLKKALQEINGFDPQFRAAGDDIDICWRLQDLGYTIGFSPAAIVWHYRRNTVKDYLKQQRGYGKAEALVYFKHPYRFNLFGQARWMGRIYGGLAAAMILQPPVIYSRVLTAEAARGIIAWENVSFEYLPEFPVLKNINMVVEPGEKIAIVGSTGTGKSTLVNLLARFYDSQQGQITINGRDIREFTIKSLRDQISMVLQPPLVFPTTIRDNIAYGRSHSTPEEVIAAAKVAHIHDFICQLPDGYETLIGEQGSTLSEGQKQRLTIARAILRDTPILILDEPTSAMDTETEALVMDGLEQLMVGKTTFIIAHRLSTIQRTDKIIVMQFGQIVEQGSFNELMVQQGVFSTLYQMSFRERQYH
ncbi:ATP-binding cassette domain-containing protein [Nodularia sphaerocarpa]|uniref:ATP-binding cassette domain-containing protein n=1 Tax=Nodularia sphaerocarpa TaxID=137816 RepID=UPI001EFB3986|nr:ATP-binding cassette domain-containing protein [Nodularia sphaerocarpa]MDB9372950.1 ATP-binding cassette domain-containing protein [Nodularia sphaerocarpa CS-585]MDB9377476.1 ATP-binding cassette domain-containing protein [Nodularia sphaerocarpa CS-585A2]ULP71689.1 Putative multidrug export ATP-binding/permease protein [Nodularia sphaerocarpa UHCC 0038]